MKPHWTYQDIIDLEYFFKRDQSVKESILHQRDRSIFLGLETSENSQGSQSKLLLYNWLEAMRSQPADDGHGSPGILFDEALRMLKIILPVITLAVGFLSGLGFFSYSGTNPVNVFHFLILFVFSQLSLLLFLLITPLLKAIGFIEASFPLSYRLAAHLVVHNVNRVQQRLFTSASAKNRGDYQQLKGLIRKIQHTYGTLLYYPFFLLTQRIMIGLNVGILAATLLKISTSDIAFGWQSTIQISSTSLYTAVKALALPWSWLFPEGVGYPSLSAIEGSRIILKDGIYHLATADLVSWWSFLVLCLLVYGLLLRLLLALAASWSQRYALSHLTFDTVEALSVIRRMQSPLVSMKGSSAGTWPSSRPSIGGSKGPSDSSQNKEIAPHPLVLLIPQEISDSPALGPLMTFLHRHGFTIESKKIIPDDYAAAQEMLNNMDVQSMSKTTGFFLVQESWMPPIREIIAFIKALCSSLGSSTPLYIGLIGKPSQTQNLTPPTATDNNVWRQHLDRLSTPYLKIFPYQDDDDT